MPISPRCQQRAPLTTKPLGGSREFLYIHFLHIYCRFTFNLEWFIYGAHNHVWHFCRQGVAWVDWRHHPVFAVRPSRRQNWLRRVLPGAVLYQWHPSHCGHWKWAAQIVCTRANHESPEVGQFGHWAVTPALRAGQSASVGLTHWSVSLFLWLVLYLSFYIPSYVWRTISLVNNLVPSMESQKIIFIVTGMIFKPVLNCFSVINGWDTQCNELDYLTLLVHSHFHYILLPGVLKKTSDKYVK